jgi:membrane associated rhomboid family serine protease
MSMRGIKATALGVLLLLAGTIGCLMLAGHSPVSWFILPPALAILLIPVGCSTVAFGFHGPAVVVRSFATLWSPRSSSAPEATRILSAFIGYVYGAGVFVFLAGLVSILSCITESGFTVGFRGNVTATIISVVYAVVLAEVVIRPLKHRLSCESL